MNAESLVPRTPPSPASQVGLTGNRRIYHFEQVGPHCLGYRFDVEAFKRATPAQLRAELDEVVQGDS